MFVLTQNDAVVARLVEKFDADVFRLDDVPDAAKQFAESAASGDGGGSYMSLVAVAYDTLLLGSGVPLTGAWPVVVVPVGAVPAPAADAEHGVTVLSLAPLAIYARDPDMVDSYINAVMHLEAPAGNGVGSGIAAVVKLAKAAGRATTGNTGLQCGGE